MNVNTKLKVKCGDVMKSKHFKITSIFLAGIIVFSACEDKDDSPNLGDAVGLWQLNSLTGTYERKIITKSGVEHSADVYNLVANWKDAAGFAAAIGADEAVITASTNFTLASFEAGDNAPGFPRTAAFDAATLAAVGISMQVELLDSKDKDSPGTYNVKGTYPSLRLDEEKCNTYLMIPPPQINDTGDWTVNYDTGIFGLSPVVDIDQVLPPFDDATFRVNREVEPATFELDFVDRDGHDTRYQEVQSTWSEADDRVISGLGVLPVNAAGAFDPTASSDPVSEGYIMHPDLAAWGGYLTWYSFNINAETKVKVADVKNPLTDLDGDGFVTPVDMMIYMHYDNLAQGGGTTAFGMPYTMLVNSADKVNPVPYNDSEMDWALGTWTQGGKMSFVINKGVCMPVNEIITFDSGWLEVVQ